MSALMPIKKRGTIAIRNSDTEWTGIFKPDGAQPVTFGSDIWERLQENWKCLKKWGENLLAYTEWNDYLNEGFCPYCGKFGLGQPFRVKLEIVDQLQKGMLAPDIEGKKHCHFVEMPYSLSKNENVDGLWIEWVYIIDPKTYTLEVAKSVRAKGSNHHNLDGKKFDQPNYRYVSVGIFSLFSEEPDWEEVQEKGTKISFYYYEKHTEIKKAKQCMDWDI